MDKQAGTFTQYYSAKKPIKHKQNKTKQKKPQQKLLKELLIHTT